jgi:hypothetical protein
MNSQSGKQEPIVTGLRNVLSLTEIPFEAS